MRTRRSYGARLAPRTPTWSAPGHRAVAPGLTGSQCTGSRCRHTTGMTRGLATSEAIEVDCAPAACGEALAWAAQRLRACVGELGAGQRGMSVVGLQWGSACVVEGVSLWWAARWHYDGHPDLVCPSARERGVRVCSQVVEYVAVCGMLRALWVELTLGVGLCGTQPVGGPLRALS